MVLIFFVMVASYHPSQYTIACGFDSGWMRVFDVASTGLLEGTNALLRVDEIACSRHARAHFAEYKQHEGAVRAILFTPDGSHLFTAAEDGTIIK